jgi:aspartate dehydrogenase
MILLYGNTDKEIMRIALIGGGTIARLVLEHVRRAELGRFEIVALLGRPGGAARARELAVEFSVKYVEDVGALRRKKPQAVIEAASHAAVKEHLVALLDAGIAVVVLSAGALIEDALRDGGGRLRRAQRRASLSPRAASAGLDALKTACLAGVGPSLDRGGQASSGVEGESPTSKARFPRWTISEARSRCSRHRARGRAALSAEREHRGDPGAGRNRPGPDAAQGRGRSRLTLNTHTIRVSGRSGRFTLRLENVPAPENPKTSWLACYSALAALHRLALRFGTGHRKRT